jgi:membrane-associated PAP2 superfamily phosphatase
MDYTETRSRRRPSSEPEPRWSGYARAASARRQLAVLALGAAFILLAASADAALSAFFYDPARRSFPFRDVWAFSVLGHVWLKWAAVALWAFCAAWGGALRRGALYMAVIAAVVGLLRYYSPVSCPWDLPQYGGSAPQTGRCLPAAHPLTGFAFFGLYLALRAARPVAARGVLAAACLIGLAAGAVQVARGAHFGSHVLWTAWIAWGITLILAALARRSARA